MKTIKLTKEEFIKRSMNGEVFKFRNYKYFYDEKEKIPFRLKSGLTNIALWDNWGNLNGENEFTIIELKPIIERRWRWALNADGQTHTSGSYRADKFAEKEMYFQDGWHKLENDYIDMEITND